MNIAKIHDRIKQEVRSKDCTPHMTKQWYKIQHHSKGVTDNWCFSFAVLPYFKAKLQELYTTALQEAKSEAKWVTANGCYMCVYNIPYVYWNPLYWKLCVMETLGAIVHKCPDYQDVMISRSVYVIKLHHLGTYVTSMWIMLVSFLSVHIN